MGSIEEKVKAIERVDEMIGTIMKEFNGRIAVLPDHPTPIRIKHILLNRCLFAILGKDKDDTTRFSEKEGAKGMYGLLAGTDLIPFLSPKFLIFQTFLLHRGLYILKQSYDQYSNDDTDDKVKSWRVDSQARSKSNFDDPSIRPVRMAMMRSW